jgi:hypothetical protein
MKRQAALFGVVFVASLLFGIQAVGGVKANPIYLGEMQPDASTDPPKITIVSPENNSRCNSTQISLNLAVTVGESLTADYTKIEKITYTVDWKSGIFIIYTTEMFEEQLSNLSHNPIQHFSEAFNITDIPAGNHLLTIFVTESGTYSDLAQQIAHPYESLSPYHSFTIRNTATANFSINSPVTPNPTLEPTRSSQANARVDNYQAITVTVGSILAVVLVSLVYLKRRKPKEI